MKRAANKRGGRWRWALATIGLVYSCTVPVDWGLGGKPQRPEQTGDAWQAKTEAGAEAFEEGRYGEAEEMLVDAKEEAEKEGGDKLDLATSFMNLAISHRQRGDWETAASLEQRALSMREEALGPDHPEVAATLNDLGATYGMEGMYETAEPLFERALAIREKSLGPDDQLTAQSVSNLAILYAAQGQYEKAEPLYQRSISIQENMIGAERADLSFTLDHYAALLSDTGREEESRQMEARAARIRKQYRKLLD